MLFDVAKKKKDKNTSYNQFLCIKLYRKKLNFNQFSKNFPENYCVSVDKIWEKICKTFLQMKKSNV